LVRWYKIDSMRRRRLGQEVHLVLSLARSAAPPLRLDRGAARGYSAPMAVPAFPFRKLAKPSLLRLLPVAAFAVGLACFAFRAPLVVVSDAAFETLYCERRAAMSRLALAARALRPVRLAVVADGAAPSAAADVAATAGPAIRVALFPARYAAGAELFASRHPGASTVVIGEGAPFGAGVIVVVPDRATDGYRVGLIAGLSAGARPVDLRADPTSDYLFIEGFRAGLEKSGWKGRFSSDGQGDSPSGAFVVVAPFAGPVLEPPAPGSSPPPGRPRPRLPAVP